MWLISGTISSVRKWTCRLLISNTQIGFIQGRFIYDLLSYTEVNNLPGLLALVDVEKAFDWMSWCCFYKVLSHIRYGNSIIKWNTNCKACIFKVVSFVWNTTGIPGIVFFSILCKYLLKLDKVVKREKKLRASFTETWISRN